jgi:XRE family transcriptional regulator, regulator of sulfur utilization
MSAHGVRDASATETRIGEVIKRLRERHGLSLRTLAARSGFSASFLSQLENGQVSPSIASLEKLTSQLGVTLADLFEASQTPGAAVVRAGDRPGFTSSWSRARVESLIPSGGRRPLEAIAVTLSPRGASGRELTVHQADQFAYVLKGPLTLFLNADRLSLDTGDAAMIPRKTPYRWENGGTSLSEVILVSVRLTT